MVSKRSLDRGEVTSQTVIVLPVVVGILFVAIQLALYFHVSHVAGAAAAQGAAAASAKGLTMSNAVERGRNEAGALIRSTGTEMVGPVSVMVAGDEVSVTVQALVPRLVPYFPASVTRTVVEPRERFIVESQR